MSATPQDALKEITTGDLGTGGTLPREMFDEFFTEVQDESVVLDRVRTVPMGREKQRIPKIGVGERLRQSQDEATAAANDNSDDVTTDFIDLDAEKGNVNWSLTRETVEENPEREDLANTVLSLMARQWAVDTEDLAIIGDEADADTFVNQNDGWIQIATDRGAPVYSHDDAGTPQPVDSTLFHETVQTIEPKYLRADPVFLMNIQQLQEYAHHLTERESGLGDAVLFGDSDLNPFGYDIVGTAMMPSDQALFTPTQNLIYGLRNDLRVEVLQESDDVFDLDLFAKYKIVGKDDFQIEDENAVVRVENIEAV